MEYLKERKEGGNEHTEKNDSGGGLDPQYYQQKKAPRCQRVLDSEKKLYFLFAVLTYVKVIYYQGGSLKPRFTLRCYF